jgi:hypothetical protein
VCFTLQRLNRLVLTRHPREEADTLVRLLTHTRSRGPEFGGLSLGGQPERHIEREVREVALPGLTATAKSSSAHSRRRAGVSPEEKQREERQRSKKASRSREKASPRRRSRSKEDKKDKKKRPRTPPRRDEREIEKSPKKKRHEAEVEEQPERIAGHDKEAEVEADFGDSSDDSSVRDDRKSPESRGHDATKSPEQRGDRKPKAPSRSPPGFRREHPAEVDDREPLQRKEKPKKDKGYNHYLRGKDFRDKYGYNRGKGRGAYNNPW